MLSVNGKLQPPYYWSGKLDFDSTVSVFLGNYVFHPGTDTMKSWTYHPNGAIDLDPSNDTTISIFNITIHPLPQANAGPDTTLCYNEIYTMQGSGGITYTWHPATYLSSPTDPKAIARLPNTERYVLIVSNQFGCSDSAVVLLKVRPKLLVNAAVNAATVCYGQNIVLSAKGRGGDNLHYQYQWNDGLTGDSVTEKVFNSGWHKIILKDNCTPTPGTDSVFVTVIPASKAGFTWRPLQKIAAGQNISFLNQSSNASSYLWTFGTADRSRAVSPAYSYPDSGEYQVRLIAYSSHNCPDDTAYGIIKIGEKITIYIPNAFSPNGDGINDTFNLNGIGIASYSYNIYNRWGEHIFENGPGHTGWDGKFKGETVMNGVYIYVIDVIDIYSYHHYLRGTVTVLK
jgi:gliding motility-associated-like protein